MWFESFADLLRVLLVGTAAYLALMLVLRLSGKRTLSQLNAFDFVVTVSLGSTLATVLLSSDTSWSEGVVALSLLAALQFAMAWTSSRVPWARKLFTSRPALLLEDGEMQPALLRENRLSESEVRQAVRMQGVGDLSQVRAVVLETNGTLSVITASQYGSGSALQDVKDPAS